MDDMYAGDDYQSGPQAGAPSPMQGMDPNQLDPALVARIMKLQGDPTKDPRVRQMDRKQAMLAKMRGNAMPQGQMVSGHYVAPSAISQIAGAASGVMAAKGEGDIEREGKAYQDEQDSTRGAYASRLTSAMRNRSGQGGTQGLMLPHPGKAGWATGTLLPDFGHNEYTEW